MEETVSQQPQQPKRMAFPRVSPGDVKNFGKAWNHNGVNIILNDSHFKFAEDFANVALRNFVQFCAAQAEAALKTAQEHQKSLVTI